MGRITWDSLMEIDEPWRILLCTFGVKKESISSLVKPFNREYTVYELTSFIVALVEGVDKVTFDVIDTPFRELNVEGTDSGSLNTVRSCVVGAAMDANAVYIVGFQNIRINDQEVLQR